jgi:micrococcal nuclease
VYEYSARLVRVVDGDTVRLDVDLGFRVWRRNESYRLARVDAAEHDDAARAALEERLTSASQLVVWTHKDDKYRRYLVEIIADGENVNDWLLAQGLARPYGLA